MEHVRWDNSFEVACLGGTAVQCLRNETQTQLAKERKACPLVRVSYRYIAKLIIGRNVIDATPKHTSYAVSCCLGCKCTSQRVPACPIRQSDQASMSEKHCMIGCGGRFLVCARARCARSGTHACNCLAASQTIPSAKLFAKAYIWRLTRNTRASQSKGVDLSAWQARTEAAQPLLHQGCQPHHRG